MLIGQSNRKVLTYTSCFGFWFSLKFELAQEGPKFIRTTFLKTNSFAILIQEKLEINFEKGQVRNGAELKVGLGFTGRVRLKFEKSFKGISGPKLKANK